MENVSHKAGDQFAPALLFDALKAILKQRKISYRELAEKVSFSEGTIKNVFHFKDASLDRVFEICQVIGLSFPELVAAAYGKTTREFTFTDEQESFFAENPQYYNFFRGIFFDRQTPEKVAAAYGLDERSVGLYLKELERVGVLERHLQGRVTFNVTGRLRWKTGGPWMRKYFRRYTDKIVDRILANGDSPETLCLFSYATLSPANRDLFYSELRELEEKYKDIAHKEYMGGNAKSERRPVTWMWAMVPTDVVAHGEDIANISAGVASKG